MAIWCRPQQWNVLGSLRTVRHSCPISTKFEISRQIFTELHKVKFHVNSTNVSRPDTWGRPTGEHEVSNRRLRDCICVVHEENQEKGRLDTRPVTLRSVVVRQQSKEVSVTFRRTVWRLTGPDHSATVLPKLRPHS